jgi:hypothetical protein
MGDRGELRYRMDAKCFGIEWMRMVAYAYVEVRLWSVPLICIIRTAEVWQGWAVHGAEGLGEMIVAHWGLQARVREIGQALEIGSCSFAPISADVPRDVANGVR